MKIKNNFYVLKILVLNAALMACSFVATAIPATVTPAPTITPTHTPQATPTIKVTFTPFYSVKAGGTIEAASGGFRFSQIYGYKIWEENNIGAYLKSQDKNVEVMLAAYPRPGGTALTGLIASWRESIAEKFDDTSFADSVKETKAGMESVYNDFTGIDNDVPFQGRLAIYEPPNAKLIYLYVIAYGDGRWQREGQQVFDATAKSIKLFTITALKDCPTTKNPDYGYLKTAPIKIGGGREEGTNRIFDYLGSLLGSKGEIVSYIRNTPTAYNGIELDTFTARIGNNRKILYFDVNTYAELFVPHGLSCSAPLPGKPKAGATF